MQRLDFNELVRNDISRLVAVEPGGDGTAALYTRPADGPVIKSTVPFRPWLLLATARMAESLSNAMELIALRGNGRFTVRAVFPDMAEYSRAIRKLKSVTGRTPGAPNAPYRVFSDTTQQLLTVLPARLFRDMDFGELRRLQLDIETLSPGEKHFPDPTRADDAIALVSLKDSTGWETCLSTAGSSEPELLEKLVSIIRERDPDVIEGHNIFNFDLKYITTRCKRFKIPFTVGRDGTEPATRESRLTVGERIIPFTRFDIHGRHVVDTYHLVLLYDLSHRDMPGHGLKTAAKYFNVAAPDRTYVAGDDINELFQTNPDKLMAYCMDDARETDALSRILSPSYFYQASLIPFSYQSCITRGTAARIDAMLCSEYILDNDSLPAPQPAAGFTGALTEGEKTGVFNNVWHVDVRSLYPSIISSRHLKPESDSKGVFLRLLTNLRAFRLAAKDARKKAPPNLKEHYDALQGTFKILINSFYGYTGFSQGTFNDFNLAAEITATGRDILSGMKNFLETAGAVVIEMDTDGIYFTPPPNVKSMDDMQARIQNTLPDGIEVEMDASFKAMLGYKSKNYALLHHDGTVTMTGAALKSRGLEPFQRRYISECVTLILTGQKDQLPDLYQKYVDDIECHRLPLADFAKREYLSSPPDTYAKKLADGTTKRSAAYELAINSGRTFAQGDPVDFYVTGNKKSVAVVSNSRLLEKADPGTRDENIPFYLAKLQQLHKKFADIV